jgi:hypothetical protein
LLGQGIDRAAKIGLACQGGRRFDVCLDLLEAGLRSGNPVGERLELSVVSRHLGFSVAVSFV